MEAKETIVTSNKFSLDWRDVAKGLLIATLTPAFVIVQSSLDAGTLVFNWKQIGMAAVAGGFAYLVKNFLTPQKVIVHKDSKTP